MRIAIISDIHEDILNLQKAMQKIEKLQCDKIFCLGDISGYDIHNIKYFSRRDAHACLEIIQKNCEIIILGNHDFNAIQKIPENIEGFSFPENWYELDYYAKKQLSENKLWFYEPNELNALYKKQDIDFLRTKNELEILDQEGRNMLFSHYAFPNLTGSLRGFYFNQEEFKDHFSFMQKHHCFYSFIGHEHANGVLVIKQNRVVEKKFTRYCLPDSPTIVIVPAIVSGKKRSGFLIFDTEKLEIEAIKL